MAINAYLIKKWYLMLTNQSVLHVNQNLGREFVPGKLHGYFNNLTDKVRMEPKLIGNNELPMNHDQSGDVVFPVTIFQYGLGAYDLYLQTGKNAYLNKLLQLSEWACGNQEASGAWNNFGFIYPEARYSAMAQGEGASLLARAFKETNDERYLQAAKRAINFMLIPLEEGGVCSENGDELVLLEYTNQPPVLNGWIFALFGLYDLSILISDSRYTISLDKTIRTVANWLTKFDNGYWSKYNTNKSLASPFYHNLHIAQLQALYLITNNNVFKNYSEKFYKYSQSNVNYYRAFLIKAIQKILE